MVLHRLMREHGSLGCQNSWTEGAKPHGIVSDAVVEKQNRIEIAVSGRAVSGMAAEDDQVNDAGRCKVLEQPISELCDVAFGLPPARAERDANITGCVSSDDPTMLR
jgi:hypothetical protein